MKNKLRTILIVTGWTASISLMTILIEYSKPPRLGSYSVAFDAYRLIILVTSFLFGMFLVDLVKILYSSIGAITLSTVTSVMYTALYDLYVLGLGKGFSEAAPGWEWEWVTWLAFLRIFAKTFPIVPILVLIGGMIGGIVSDWMWPHRG